MFKEEKIVSPAEVWPILETQLKQKNMAELYKNIDCYESFDNRNAIHKFIIRKLAFTRWANDYLDIMIEIAERNINEALAEANFNPDRHAFWKDQANVTCYNISTNLADCWGDH